MPCTFNDFCERTTRDRSIDGHRPFIGQAGEWGCPLTRAELVFDKGGNIFHQGDPVRGAYSLTSGLVAVERVDEAGEIVIIRLLRPGALFPCADLFADGMHGTGARALSRVEACFIPLERLDAALSQPLVRRALLRQSCDEARRNEDTIFRLCASHLADRVLALLDDLATDTPVATDGTRSLTLPLSWRDIAAMVGTSPEVLSRTLRKLVDDRRLIFTGRYITLAAASEDRRQFG